MGAIKSWSKSYQTQFSPMRHMENEENLHQHELMSRGFQQGVACSSSHHDSKEQHRIEHYEVLVHRWNSCGIQNGIDFSRDFTVGRTITIMAKTWACRCIFGIALSTYLRWMKSLRRRWMEKLRRKLFRWIVSCNFISPFHYFFWWWWENYCWDGKNW